MYNVIEEHNEIKLYNFSSLITEEDNREIRTVAKTIIDSGNFFHNSPKYQTKENLFARPEPVWLKMRQSFVYSCFMYLGKEVRIKNIMSWVFMTSAKDSEDRNNLWHHHHVSTNNGQTNTVSGVWYVYIPKDVSNPDVTGTEFSFDFPNQNNNVFLKPKELTWAIYSSKIWHRPGITDSNDYRFVFAADMEYFV